MQQPSEEAVKDSIKEMLASAMALGMAFSDKQIVGDLYDSQHVSLINDIEVLAESVKQFLNVNNLGDVSVEDLLPLYKEIVTQLPTRAA